MSLPEIAKHFPKPKHPNVRSLLSRMALYGEVESLGVKQKRVYIFAAYSRNEKCLLSEIWTGVSIKNGDHITFYPRTNARTNRQPEEFVV